MGLICISLVSGGGLFLLCLFFSLHLLCLSIISHLPLTFSILELSDFSVLPEGHFQTYFSSVFLAVWCCLFTFLAIVCSNRKEIF